MRKMAFTFKEVAEILKIIDASQCEEVVIEVQGLRLVVRRGSPHGAWSDARQGALQQGSAIRPASTDPTSGVARSFGRNKADFTVAEGHVAVRAPMVGSFYRRASPQDPPFVEIGRRVKSDDPLCLIEVMKLFTTIPAPVDGVIEAIAAEDGAAVEFGQLLFVIRPDA